MESEKDSGCPENPARTYGASPKDKNTYRNNYDLAVCSNNLIIDFLFLSPGRKVPAFIDVATLGFDEDECDEEFRHLLAQLREADYDWEAQSAQQPDTPKQLRTDARSSALYSRAYDDSGPRDHL